MQIERLYSPVGDLYVGISVAINENRLSKDELISAATNLSNDLTAVQLLNAYLVVNTHHLLSAVQNAVNAWYGDYAQARSLDIEIAVYASGQKQIGRALGTFGVSEEVDRIAIVIVGTNKETIAKCSRDLHASIGPSPAVPFPPEESRFTAIMNHFNIDELELETIMDSNDLSSIQEALSRCVASRVSSVALES